MSKISWETLSVTSRRGAPTSRCQNYISLPCRDVKFTSLYHVETWIYTSRRQIYISLSRRNVDLHVATSSLTPLCHVATWIYTSRRQLVQVSVTSRRGPARRDVVWSCALSRRDVTPNVATWSCLLSVTSRCDPERRDVVLFTLCDVATSPRTSRRDPGLRPKTVHFFGTSPCIVLHRNPNTLAHPYHTLPELLFALVRDSSTARRTL